MLSSVNNIKHLFFYLFFNTVLTEFIENLNEFICKTMTKSLKLDHIFYLFWCLTHLIVSFVLLTKKYLFKTKNYFKKDINYLINCLNKIPKHIAICINEDSIDFKQISKLIQWCQQFNICYVSLYSNDIFISSKELETHLFHRINGHKSDVNVNHQKNGFKKCQTNGLNGNSNRVITCGNTKVCVVTYEDSHQSIVRVAKHLCTQKEPFDQNDISEHLRKTFDFPDPELLMSFGDSPSVYGYPLWQLRLTEMYFLPTHRYFRFNDFYEVLIKYSKSEQRFGK